MIAALDFAPVWEQREALVSGLGTMALISVVSFALSIVGGLVLASMRQSRSVPVRVTGFVLIQVMRGIALVRAAAVAVLRARPRPAGSASTRSRPASWRSSLLNSAYMAEVFRAGYEAVPPGQKEAALAIGLPGARGSGACTSRR